MLYLVHVSVDEQIVAGGECQLDIRVVVGRVLVWIVRVLGYEDLERHRLTAAIRRTTGGVLCQPRVNHLLQQTNRIAESNQHDNFHHNLKKLLPAPCLHVRFSVVVTRSFFLHLFRCFSYFSVPSYRLFYLYFASAAVAADSSRMVASSSASCSTFSPRFVCQRCHSWSVAGYNRRKVRPH